MSTSQRKFAVAARPSTPVTSSLPSPDAYEAYLANAAMVKSQTGGRDVKPVRVNFDMDPPTHQRLKKHAIDRGMNVATLLRQLIEAELAR